MLPTRLPVALVRLGTTNLNMECRAIECYDQGERRAHICVVCVLLSRFIKVGLSNCTSTYNI